MQRGILTLSKDEYTQLTTVLDINRFTGTQLYEKLKSASQTSQQDINILLSADEIEKILDEVGPPVYENNSLNSVIQKIHEMLTNLRQ